MGASAFSPPEEPEAPCGVDSEGEESDGGASPRGSQDENELLDLTMTREEKMAAYFRDNETDEGCEFEEDLPTYWVDMCHGDNGAAEGDYEDVNLIKNPERNTGYNGSHIWEAMYNENCFEVGSGLPRGRFGNLDAGMCYEERVLYRLLSGWHASTTISIFKNYFAPGTKLKGAWSPNPEKYMDMLGQHPERLKNLHFSFVVLLRAIKKAAPFLQSYHYATGDEPEDGLTQSLVTRLLDSQVLSLCSPLFDAFDESSLFRTTSPDQRGPRQRERSLLKRQFKSVFQNITVLVDCVQCQRCRLHAKLFSQGLGAAIKILLSPSNIITSTTSRDEVVALVNVLWKLSESMEDARELTELYFKQHKPGQPAEPKGDSSQVAKGGGQAAIPPAESLAPVGMGEAARQSYLDAALGAVRRAAASGSLADAGEVAVLRSLVVRPPRDEVLLLAKHYAGHRPELFAALALEAAQAGEASGGVTVGGASTAAVALLGSAAAPADAVVIGGGLAGMVATMSLLDRGGRVVLVDKQPYLGGNSGKASSGINAALETSIESLIKDTTKSAGVLARPDLIEKLANDSAQAVSWLKDRTNVDLSMRSQLGGHTAKRTLRPSNAFVGAEITFAAGQLLNKIAAERPGHFRLLTKTKWTGLARGGGGWQVQATSKGADEAIHGSSVVIASGGFGHDAKEVESLLLKNRPDLADFPTTLGSQTTGDGLKIARDIGAQLIDMDRVQLHPTGFVDPAKPAEHTKTLAAELLRGVGGLLLDRRGNRFTDELGTRQAVVNAELKATESGGGAAAPAPPRTFALVLNGKAAAMADRHVTLYSKKGLLTKVSKLSGLAAHLNVTEGSLQKTFAAYNDAAKAGKDAFGRTVFPAGHWPIEWDEDFYVGQIVPVIHYTMGGIAIDTDGRVLASEDNRTTIPGLYAIGEASGGVHGDNRLAGNSLLECTVFGRHVGLTLPLREPDAASTQASLPAAAGQAASSSSLPAEALRVITAKELAEHNSQDQRVWVALYGKVYDLTDYIEEHPGGAQAITDVGGVDGTEHFAAVHNRELLESMGFEPVGVLEG